MLHSKRREGADEENSIKNSAG